MLFGNLNILIIFKFSFINLKLKFFISAYYLQNRQNSNKNSWAKKLTINLNDAYHDDLRDLHGLRDVDRDHVRADRDLRDRHDAGHVRVHVGRDVSHVRGVRVRVPRGGRDVAFWKILILI